MAKGGEHFEVIPQHKFPVVGSGAEVDRVFDDYLSGLPDDQRQVLRALVDQVAAIAPVASEGRSYGVPAFLYKGRPLLGFAVNKGHLSLYPFSPAVLEATKAQLDGFELSKGTVRFTADRPIAGPVLAELVRRRMTEIDGVDGE